MNAINNKKYKTYLGLLCASIGIMLLVLAFQNTLFPTFVSAQRVTGAALDKKAEDACAKDTIGKKNKDGCAQGYKVGYEGSQQSYGQMLCRYPNPTMSNPGATSVVLGCDRGLVLGERGAKDDSVGGVDLDAATKACAKYQNQRVKANFHACTAAYAAAKKAGKVNAAKCSGANKEACQTGANAGKKQFDEDKKKREKEREKEREEDGEDAKEAAEIEKEKDPALDCIDNRDKCDLMRKYVNPIIGFLTALVGIAVTIGLISGGIRYASAGNDPQKTGAAKKQITSAILALLALFILYALIRWLAPALL